jgi:hypothetical protein
MLSVWIAPPLISLVQSDIALGITGIEDAPVPPKEEPKAKILASVLFAFDTASMNL